MGIIIVLVILFAFWLVGLYNTLVKMDGEVDGKWAQVDTQYQRRFDLIPNLVESVKGVMAQEKEVFSNITEARTRYSGATTPSDRAEAATGVESALGRFLDELPSLVLQYKQLQFAQEEESLRQTLLHEVAHVLRRDQLVVLLQRLTVRGAWWIARVFATWQLLSIGWVFFRSESIAQAVALLGVVFMAFSRLIVPAVLLS